MEAIYRQLAELARRHGAQRLVLFGSRARGDNKERSDIDLAVYGMPQKERATFWLDAEDLPTLLKLAEKHLRKLDAGQKVYYSKQIGELINRITESYPAHLTLSDQGIFQLGYYHQTQKRYTPKHTTNPNNLKEETDHV